MISLKYMWIAIPIAVATMTQTAAEIEIQKENGVDCSNYSVTASQLNVRERPNISSNIVDKLQKNESICIFDSSGKWAKFDKGWVHRKYILIDAIEDDPQAIEVVDTEENITEPDQGITKESIEDTSKEQSSSSDTQVKQNYIVPAETEVKEPEPEPEAKEEVVEVRAAKEEVEEKVETIESTEAVEVAKNKESSETEQAVEERDVKELVVKKEDTDLTNYLTLMRIQEGARGENSIFLFEAKGDRCEMMILEKNTILVNTCKPAINDNGDKMLCTWNMKACKREADILKDCKTVKEIKKIEKE